jgi:hypothetical protein
VRKSLSRTIIFYAWKRAKEIDGAKGPYSDKVLNCTKSAQKLPIQQWRVHSPGQIAEEWSAATLEGKI